LQHYIYDANGERVLKANSDHEETYQNGTLLNAPGTVSINGYTSYPSAFIVITSDGVYSKHYYAGTQRIVSRLGEQDAKIFNVENCRICQQQNNNGFDPNQLQQAQKADLQMNADELKKGKIRYKEYKAIPLTEQENAMAEQNTDSANPAIAPPSGVGGLYFYHPDHLGTSTALTDYFGKAYQIEDSSNTNEKYKISEIIFLKFAFWRNRGTRFIELQ